MITRSKKTLWQQVKQVMVQTEGKWTEELAQTQSKVTQGKLPKRLLPDYTQSMICGYCSTGCNLEVHMKGHQAINVTPAKGYPVNNGDACPKGWEVLSPLKAADRAMIPQVRNAQGKLEPTDWHNAMTMFVERFKAIQAKYGDESVAFLSTGQIPIEEMALLGALAKFGMGWVHGDGNTRQCMASAVVAYKQAFGFDAPPFTYQDFEESDVMIFVGANPCIAHPILWKRVEKNRHNPKIIVLDPRTTETAMAATHHYALTPKSDLTLLYAVANYLIQQGWIDQEYIKAHTTDFETFSRHVAEFSLEMASQVSGIPIESIESLAGMIHAGKRVSFWWMVGVNQGHQAVRTAQVLINLALMTGNIGRPGTGANSITGQANAMGSRLFSNTTNLLGGYDFTQEADRHKVAKVLGLDPSVIPSENSLPYDKILERVAGGQIKGLWIIATNPAHSWINQKAFQEIIKELDFCVVQDMYISTETAQCADLILPAAGAGEKEGVFINSERRLGVLSKVAKAPGKALADFYIFKLIARYWGCEAMFESWQDPEAVFQILKKVSQGQPCDISGIKDYAMLVRQGGVQWPLSAGVPLSDNQRRLFGDGQYFHADGKAKFLFDAIVPVPEPVNEDYPLVLMTGRGTSAQWHTQTRTSKSAVLRKLYPSNGYVEINGEDARKRHIVQGQWVIVATRRAKLRVQASVVSSVRLGQIFIPMHYEGVNTLTFPAFDPYSRQPSFKHCAAQVYVDDYFVIE